MQLRGSALAGRCIMALPDKVKAAWDALAIQMAEDMKRDDLSWSKEWSFDTPPVSVETGKPYRGRNAVLCLYAMRVNHLDDPRFMTYNAAKRAGFSVRRGEKAVAVIERWKRFAFLRSDPERRIRQPKNEEEWKEALKDPDIAVRPACVGYFNLFSATQIDGIEPFELPNRDIPPLDEFALDVLKGISPCPVNETYNDRAFYSPSEDGITVPLRSQFSSPEAFAAGAGVVAAEAADADAGRAAESAAAPVDVAVARAEAGVASESVQKIDTPQRRNIRFMLILDFLSWHPLLVPTPCQNI